MNRATDIVAIVAVSMAAACGGKALGLYRAAENLPAVPQNVAPEIKEYEQDLRNDAQDMLETGGIVVLAGLGAAAMGLFSRRILPGN